MDDETSAAVRERMRTASTDELTRICTTEAGDYTDEAIAIAREVLVSRGVDVSTLVASPPVQRAESPAQRGAKLIVAALALGLVSVSLSHALPSWVGLVLQAGAGVLAAIGAMQLFARRGS